MWKKPIGGGRSSFAVAGGRAFTIEQRQRNEVVVAYDVMTGQELWTNAWPERFSQWMGGGEGPAGHAGLGGWPRVRARRAGASCAASTRRPGRLVWRTNILQDTGAKNLRWGMAGSPLIAGDAVIVLPGGPDGRSVAAYDRRTGKRLWTALDDKQAYVSPMQVTLLGVPQFLVVSGERLVGLSLDRRDVLWEFPWTTDHDASAAQPIVIGDNRVFYSSGYGTGAVVVELTKDGDRFGVRQVWRNIRMKNRQSSSVLHDGFIYGLDEGILACLDAATGDAQVEGRALRTRPAAPRRRPPRRHHRGRRARPRRRYARRSFRSWPACRRSRAKPGTCRRLPTASCSSATRRRWRRSTCAPTPK